MKLTLEQAKRYYTLACDVGPVYHSEDEWNEIWKEMQVLCDAKSDQEAAKTIEWWRVWCGDYTAVAFARKVRQAYREEHGITESATGIEAEVCQDIAERQIKGIAKYGTTVESNPLNLKQWLQHAYEETLDQAIYLKRAIKELK